MLHCHIDIHHGEGMAMIIQEGESDEIANVVDLNEVNLCENNLEAVQITSRRPILSSQLSQTSSTSRDALVSLLNLILQPFSKLLSALFAPAKVL